MRGSPSGISLVSGIAQHVLAEFLEYDRKTRFVGEYMTKVDGATMHYALEARSPFLDQELWEFASSLPTDLRLHGGRLKSVLRELAARKVGQRVARGRKRGFSIPVQRWLAGRWHRAFEELLHDSILESGGWIRSEPAFRLASEVDSSRMGTESTMVLICARIVAAERAQLRENVAAKRIDEGEIILKPMRILILAPSFSNPGGQSITGHAFERRPEQWRIAKSRFPAAQPNLARTI